MLPAGGEYAESMMAFFRTQTEVLQRAARNDESFLLGDGLDGCPAGLLKGAKEREWYRRRIMEKPLEVVAEWKQAAKRELNHHEGEPFSPAIYGSVLLQKHFTEHTTLWRMWILLSEIEMLLDRSLPEAAHAQTVCALKAVAKALLQGGNWKGAWEFTYRPDLREVGGGVTEAEKATIGRLLRERSQLDEIIKKQISGGGG